MLRRFTQHFERVAMALVFVGACAPSSNRTDQTLGAECGNSADCSSGICVAIDETRSICTSSCRNASECPEGNNWDCVTSAQGPSVCGCVPDAVDEVCGDGRDNDCDGDTDGCEPCGAVMCPPGAACVSGVCSTSIDGGIRDGGVDASGADTGAECECVDDGVPCTDDRCVDGSCVHLPNHTSCGFGMRCDRVSGCTLEVCATTADCPSDDRCFVASCDAARRVCVYTPLDGDMDGFAPIVCGGEDCDDSRADVNPSIAQDVCDGVDADCSGGPDPVDAPGCDAPLQQCNGFACACLPGTTFCIDTCTDYATNSDHCGFCGNECATEIGEVCVDGECGCPPGQTICSGVCVDTESDDANCGACDNSCGEASCSLGECGCGAGVSSCLADGVLECADLSTDPRHCSACFAACFPGSGCGGGACDVSLDSVRSYVWVGDDTTPDSRKHATIDASTGRSFLAASEPALPVTEHGTAGPPAFVGGNNIIGFTAGGDVDWVVETTLTIQSIKAGGGHVYAVGWTREPSATLAGSTFTATQPGSMVVLAELDPLSGLVIASRVIGDAPRSPRYTINTDDDGNLAFIGWLYADADVGGGPLDIGDGYALFARYSPGLVHEASWRVPISLFGIGCFIDPAGNIVIQGEIANPTSFGGPTIGVRLSGRTVVVRYTETGAHLSSFVTAANGSLVLAAEDGVLLSWQTPPMRGPDQYLSFYEYAGEGATRVDTNEIRDTAWLYDAVGYERDGHFYVALWSGESTTLGGQTFDLGRQAMLVRFDRATLAIERLGVLYSPNSRIREAAGEVLAMSPVGPDQFRVIGNHTGTMRFGATELVADPYAFGTYLGTFSFTP